jgi:type IV fimbrial biogenesis protein FimT
METLNLRPKNGFTLIELLVTLVIMAILISLGIPSFTKMTERAEFRSDLSLLHRTISMARAKATYTGWPVAVCPLDTSNKCHNDWTQSLTVFEDRNSNNIKDENEPLVYLIESEEDKRIVRQFNRNSAISFSPRGHAFGSNGTLIYCQNGSSTLGGTIIIANTGRIRLGEDKNNDGIAENSKGKNINCNI